MENDLNTKKFEIKKISFFKIIVCLTLPDARGVTGGGCVFCDSSLSLVCCFLAESVRCKNRLINYGKQ